MSEPGADADEDNCLFCIVDAFSIKRGVAFCLQSTLVNIAAPIGLSIPHEHVSRIEGLELQLIE